EQIRVRTCIGILPARKVTAVRRSRKGFLAQRRRLRRLAVSCAVTCIYSSRSSCRGSINNVVMPTIRHVQPSAGDSILLVGTMKGAFIARADHQRRAWEMGGPYFPGHMVYAMAHDTRGGRHRVWAGPNSMHWGGMLHSSDDFGRSWTNPVVANVKF